MKPEIRYGLLAVLYSVLTDNQCVQTMARRLHQTVEETDAHIRSLVSQVQVEEEASHD